MNKPKKECNPAKSNPAAKSLRKKSGDVKSDVLGSYTGLPFEDLHPVQDADDL